MRTIKRYKNRKLYDTQTSKYITLAGLGELIQRNEDLRVIDADTKEDITGTILTQVLLQEQKKQGMPVALTRLRELLHTGMQRISTEAERTVQKPLVEARQFIESTLNAFDDLQKMVDERIDSIMASIKLLSPLQSDCRQLQKRLKELEERVKQLEQTFKKE